MNSKQRSSVQELKNDQSSILSQTPYRQTQFNYQYPKIDHAFIVQNYRRLRIQQRDQLARLRMPDDIKRKIFDFKPDQNLKHEKPQLTIFNHPFRGKIVLTKDQLEKQLQKQRKNAQTAEQHESKGGKIPQNILNEMGLEQQQLQLKKTKMVRQQKSDQQNYPRKPRLVSDQLQRKTAEEINRQQQKVQQDKVYFIHKNKQKQETKAEQNQKMQKQMDEKKQKQQYKKREQVGDKDLKEKNYPKQKNPHFSDMPIIGQEPKVVRDIKFESTKVINRKQNVGMQLIKQETGKRFYRPFGNQNEVQEFQINPGRKPKKYTETEDRFVNRQDILNKREMTPQNKFYVNQNDKSISQISAIPSNDKQDDLVDSQSLNNALFMN